ncbi:protein of unknown function [Cupriavidus taiwanensis]|uniref:Uncharacterized protein n=1 Tax=Cupriavidus taiwanensis TaxID=164546 RepID=A0A7Z7J8R4_9BURK|nr:protein of unknown function [Cupriavidus taiwanensis]SOZ05979.1 hypothetical protein CBM2595_A80664 [Cupriavidus taiwanensis]SOZ07964.1 hypothetical protein CBM2597_A90570 [Cupriavidus taiwanensis]SPC16001.1 hypothetical protein CBM2594_A70566 [Cupriavidus taiwanensis]SPD40699.1 protein of unknown function [Cupriavidus taiwanensis]
MSYVLYKTYELTGREARPTLALVHARDGPPSGTPAGPHGANVPRRRPPGLEMAPRFAVD